MGSSPVEKGKYIVIEGPIGVGKTSLVNLLAKRFSARKILEAADENPFLPQFYEDTKRHAFQTQLFFLLSRFRQQQELAQQDLFQQFVVADYLFDRDRIFAYLNLDDNELALYEQIYSLLKTRVTVPDVVIYLQASTDVLVERIARHLRALLENAIADPDLPVSRVPMLDETDFPRDARGRITCLATLQMVRPDGSTVEGAWSAGDTLAYDEIIDPREMRNMLPAGLKLALSRRTAPARPAMSRGVWP